MRSCTRGAVGIAADPDCVRAACTARGKSGSVGTVGSMSVVNLPSPNAVFQDVAADGYVLPKDIPADAAPAG